jgi:hypothetical protein
MSRQIFVFGSNLAGRHGKGAALEALRNHGAVYGRGEGLQGNSYAIPTKGYRIETLKLPSIQRYVSSFLEFATQHPEFEFNVTRVGCGLAGYTDDDIAPMFISAGLNVNLPPEWEELYKQKYPARVLVIERNIGWDWTPG